MQHVSHHCGNQTPAINIGSIREEIFSCNLDVPLVGVMSRGYMRMNLSGLVLWWDTTEIICDIIWIDPLLCVFVVFL